MRLGIIPHTRTSHFFVSSGTGGLEYAIHHKTVAQKVSSDTGGLEFILRIEPPLGAGEQ